VEAGYAPYNPAAGLRGARRRGTSKQHKRDELTAGEIRRVLATFDDTPTGRRDKAMVALMAYCALRQIEIHRADKGDLKTRDGRLVLWVQGKGHSEKDEFVVLPIPAEEAVRDWLAVHPLKSAGPLFVGIGNRSKWKRLGLRAIRGIVKEHYHLVGVVGDGKTTHSLRHSAISAAIRNGATIQQVQAMARHSNISTTMIYFHETSRTANPAEDFVRYE
jgi:integrase